MAEISAFIKRHIIQVALLFLAGCSVFPGYRFATTSSYIIAEASHPAVVINAGGRVGGGDDIPDVSFATIEFSGKPEKPDLIMLCRPGGREFWLSAPPPPDNGIVYEWLAENAQFGGFIQRNSSWLETATKRIGVDLDPIADKLSVQSVFSSHLNGPKGTPTSTQLETQSLVQLSQVVGPEPPREWVDGMLHACNANRDP